MLLLNVVNKESESEEKAEAEESGRKGGKRGGTGLGIERYPVQVPFPLPAVTVPPSSPSPQSHGEGLSI